ncbi:hypothetical protein MUK42_00208 [Musa troglodytarum]|uniref:Uncharacterized protein n=1 Tax=Musa troglodytarum TaxID=320322 RepID=A0A9E7FC56_9LILI|nr:hypothetical protein MUK42_00208 [Musa troglodytarum]
MAVLDDQKPSMSDSHDSLSFRYIPIAVREGPSGPEPSPVHRALSSSPDAFEFFTLATDMCYADDVFLEGKLLSSHPRTPPRRTLPLVHRRSESLDESRQPRGPAGKRHRQGRAASDLDPPSAMKPLPKWYLFVLAPKRMPAAMEMEDIRNRQTRRRSPPTSTGCKSMERRGPWKLLRSLSCTGAHSVATSSRLARTKP